METFFLQWTCRPMRMPVLAWSMARDMLLRAAVGDNASCRRQGGFAEDETASGRTYGAGPLCTHATSRSTTQTRR
eukprot:125153-Rhodomonas_salina.2